MLQTHRLRGGHVGSVGMAGVQLRLVAAGHRVVAVGVGREVEAPGARPRHAAPANTDNNTE